MGQPPFSTIGFRSQFYFRAKCLCHTDIKQFSPGKQQYRLNQKIPHPKTESKKKWMKPGFILLSLQDRVSI